MKLIIEGIMLVPELILKDINQCSQRCNGKQYNLCPIDEKVTRYYKSSSQ